MEEVEEEVKEEEEKKKRENVNKECAYHISGGYRQETLTDVRSCDIMSSRSHCSLTLPYKQLSANIHGGLHSS